MHPKCGLKSLVTKGIDVGWVLALAKLGGLAFCALVAKLVKNWSHGVWAILVGKCHNCMQNEVWNVWLHKDFILVGFWLSQVWWICFSALVAKLVKKWNHGVWAILVGNCQKCIENEVSKVWLQKELILVGFCLSKVGWIAFCGLVAKLVKKWNHGVWAILIENCHKCIQNEVSNVWLQKELILVGFWLIQVGWNGFLCLGRKVGEEVKSWFLSNLGGELSQMYPKWGVKSLVAKGVDLGWVLA